MRSKKQLASALALSAVLALGTSSLAFAVDEDATGSAGDAGAGLTTNVKIVTKDLSADDTDEGQLSVTVPLDITIVADAKGGDIVGPDASRYCIANNSNSVNVKVTGVCAVTGKGLNLLLTDEQDEVGENVEAPKNYDGALKMTLTPKDDKDSAWDVSGACAGWVIKGGSCINLEVSGSTSKLNKLFEVEETAPTSLTITYTVAKVETEGDE